MNVIISVVNNNSIDDLKNTLYSLGGDQVNITIIASGSIANQLSVESIHQMCPVANVSRYINNGTYEDFHMNNFYDAIHDFQGEGDIVTFLKCGDRFIGQHLIIDIEKTFSDNPELLTMHYNIVSNDNLNIYTSKEINLQGWFFRRGFLDYYVFLKTFKNEVEFTLHLSYIADLQPQYNKFVNSPMVYTKHSINDIGEACKHYFNEILPQQNYFDVELGLKYLYGIICDCYISYIQGINGEMSDEDMQSLIFDIGTFYNYFKLLELDNIELLLKTFNNKMKEIYQKQDDLFLMKIPDITFTEFLENFEDKE
jgi:hypothetical protein